MNATVLNTVCSDTLRRLSREGRVVEAAAFLGKEFSALYREDSFGAAVTEAFIPAVIRAARLDIRSVADAVCVAWRIADDLKFYPDEPTLGELKDLVLPAIEWSRGQEAAVTLAQRNPSLPHAAEYRSRGAATAATAARHKPHPAGTPIIRLERRVAVTEYRFGSWESTSAAGKSAKRTLLRSPQEREFLKAARMFFVGREVLPNIRLTNFIDLDQLASKLPAEIRRYGTMAEADVLIVSPVDYDPIGVIELDSGYHDTPIARLRDSMKERLLEHAGIPFVRLRAENCEAIHADNFYSLLQDQWPKFESFRLQGWREREMHARLLPAA